MTLAEASVSVDVYLPSEASPQGAAILAHGFGGTRRGHRDLAQALAAAGFIAIVPDLPGFLDPRATPKRSSRSHTGSRPATQASPQSREIGSC